VLSGCAAGYNKASVGLASGGLNIAGIVYTPDSMLPGVIYPAVVLNHGGVKGVEFATRSWARALAKKGYVVILPQFRGQGGSEGHMEFAGGEVDDCLAALEYIKGLPYVDKGRIGMIGYSLGGLVTLRALERTRDVRAAVLVSAISDPEVFMRRLADKKGLAPADLQAHLAELKARNPLPGLGEVTASVLILHGLDDATVDPAQARELYGALKAAGKDVEAVYFLHLGHASMWYSAPMESAVEFLDRRLGHSNK